MVDSDTRIKNIDQEKDIRSFSRIKVLDNEDTRLSDSLVILNPSVTTISDTIIGFLGNKILAYSYSKIIGVQKIIKLSDTVIKNYGTEITKLSDTQILREPVIDILSGTTILVLYEISGKPSDTLVINRDVEITTTSDSAIFRVEYGNIEKESQAVIKNLDYKIIYISNSSIKREGAAIEVSSDTAIRRDRASMSAIFEKGRHL